MAVIGVDGHLNLLHHLRTDALDFFQFFGRHAAQLFDGADTRFQQLLHYLFRQTVIDQYGNRSARSHQRGHLRLHFLPLLFLALDIDLPTQQLGRQAHILALLANGEGKLRIVHDHFHVLFRRIDDADAADLGRAERMGGENHRIVGVLDDVDLLPAQFADDRLHAHALHTHAGAHAIHIAIAALYGDLGAFAGLARAALDGHGAVVNLRHFLFEKAHHQFGRGARYQHARTFAGLIHQLDDAPHAIAHAVAFQPRLLFLGKLGFGLAQVQNVIRPLHPLDGAVHQFAGASRILIKNGFAFGLADFLEDHLFGGLGGDAAQRFGILPDAHFHADFDCRIDAARFRQGHFMRRVLDDLGYLLDGIELDGARLGIHIRQVIFVRAVMFPGGDQHGVLDCIQDDLRVDTFFLAQYLYGLKNRFQSALVIPIKFC